MSTHKHSGSVTLMNQKAILANAYNELGKELSSNKIRVVGNYTLGKVIGEGAYGKVRMGTHRLTSVRVAIKQIPKAMSASLTREIHHHRQLHHPHVTQMYEVIATESSIWIVTELCCGGELFDYLVEKGRLSEDETKVIFGQLCLAVGYLHDKGIVHRDLKLENVLLDERCRVKLGDFGFTREFERGALMETFCGTTGYASPEMLQGRKYLGPEVDIWSLGIILYCLLTGTLPFDDDDENLMRQKIIVGEFEDPEWLSIEARDLIKNILQQDPTKRLGIAQILAHAWFTIPTGTFADESSTSTSHSAASETTSESNLFGDVYSSTPTTPDEPDFKGDALSSGVEKARGIPRTPSELTIRKMDLETLHSKLSSGATQPAVLEEDESAGNASGSGSTSSAPQRMSSNLSISSKGPPTVLRTPARTKRRSVSSIPSSDPSSLGLDEALTEEDGEETEILTPDVPASLPSTQPGGNNTTSSFASLLSAPAPVIFSTPLERELLNSLSALGFDIAQIVHSVLTDACDASGAVWWMVRRGRERRVLEGVNGEGIVMSPAAIDEPVATGKGKEKEREKGKGKATEKDSGYITANDLPGLAKINERHATVGVQTDPAYAHSQLVIQPQPRGTMGVLPQLSFVPPTPTFPSSSTSATTPSSGVPAMRSLTPPPGTPSILARSHPSTPAGSVKDGGREGKTGRKGRSGSVSIMQRATTALEAAGLVRKKSSEAFKEEREQKEREKEHKEKEKEKTSREVERKGSTGTEETRSSHGSSGPATASKLTKSPPLRPSKDHNPPSTPPPPSSDDLHHPHPVMGSPWVLTGSRDSLAQQQYSHHGHGAPTPANSPGVDVRASMSTPNFGNGHGGDEHTAGGSNSTGKAAGSHRNRANLLTAFRLWFNDDRKGKRKQNAGVGAAAERGPGSGGAPAGGATHPSYNRNSSAPQPYPSTSGHRQRPSASSRRSSSVNSRRSSITSVQMVVLDSPQVPGRRSFGSHTPNSDRGSRPSSIRSFSMQRHRKSPSASSAGSVNLRTTSPIQKYHRRNGSGGSTRVVRHIQTTTTTTTTAGAPGGGRPPHHRSNSGASSTYSPTSSRPTSFYEQPGLQRSVSDVEGFRTGSPFKSNSRPSSRARNSSGDESSRRGYTTTTTSTTFIAQKRSGAFTSPSFNGSIGRSSWKKSWGLEPPGWQSRTAHLPIEVLAMSPVSDVTTIRDVFSGGGRHGLGLGAVGVGSGGDESDWVDEDDDVPAFAGGLGQMATSMSGSSSSHHPPALETVTLSPAPRGHRPNKRTTNRSGGSGSASSSSGGPGGARQNSKGGQSPSISSTPLPVENALYESVSSTGRRQLPAGRSGPAFRQAIQEEDEGEEE
ncbi:Pkinase-domain-containing protein [Mycena alexandri]|uniref:Pkinase-domain-containing protein n=1 Tax=Mycena alexandri TaxID=1745969 RepID=A0AAD6T919_9AGAR|nr:Pkinase-domain-containing protein [Mycena alexandri]